MTPLNLKFKNTYDNGFTIYTIEEYLYYGNEGIDPNSRKLGTGKLTNTGNEVFEGDQITYEINNGWYEIRKGTVVWNKRRCAFMISPSGRRLSAAKKIKIVGDKDV